MATLSNSSSAGKDNHARRDHFGFLSHGDLRAFCDELRAQGVHVPVPLKEGVGGRLLCDVAAPDGVSLERMQG